jgi:hypothetical protein
MSSDNRRLAFGLAPLSIVAIGLSMMTCAWISAARADTIYLLYAVAGFGLAAGVLQWRFRRQIIARTQATARNTLAIQLYGMLVLTAICAAPGVLVGRLLAGSNPWTGA